MALKKAYCIKCKVDDPTKRIFDVNSEAQFCYCPKCLSKFEPSVVIDAYDHFIEKLVKKARYNLYEATAFEKSYRMFADIIDIDPTNCSARFGRLLSLAYLSKLRKATFNDVYLILKNEKDLYFHSLGKYDNYLDFIDKLNRAVDEYQSLFKRKITSREHFYDTDCLELYLRRLNEILKLKTLLVDELEFIGTKKIDEGRFADIMSSVKKSINQINSRLKEIFVMINGDSYSLVGFSTVGNALLSRRGSDNKKHRYASHLKITLDQNAKHKRIIKDQIYPDNQGIAKATRVFIPLNIFFAILALTCLLIFVLNVKANFALIFLFAAAGFSLVTIVFLVLYLVFRHRLKLRRHLLD